MEVVILNNIVLIFRDSTIVLLYSLRLGGSLYSRKLVVYFVLLLIFLLNTVGTDMIFIKT